MAGKKDTMTNRERIECLLKREKPDRIPIWPFASVGFSAKYMKLPISDAYNKPEKAYDAQRKTAEEFDWVFLPMFVYAAMGGWEFGGEINWPSGEFSQAPSVLKYAVETPEDAMNLKMPDVKKSGIIPMMMEFGMISSKERLHNEPFNIFILGGGVFTVAANIPGPQRFCKWIIRNPQAVHRMMRLATDWSVEVAQWWKNTFGTDGVLPMGGEPTSANQVISAKMFEEFALPYIKETQEKILAMGYKTTYMHICGEQNANLPYWAQVPFGNPGIISIGHEVKLETAAKYFPSDIILGNLEPAIIQVGTPEEVYKATKKNIEDGKKISQGYIFSPGCELPPMAPIENVRAMTKAVNDFGWYD